LSQNFEGLQNCEFFPLLLIQNNSSSDVIKMLRGKGELYRTCSPFNISHIPFCILYSIIPHCCQPLQDLDAGNVSKICRSKEGCVSKVFLVLYSTSCIRDGRYSRNVCDEHRYLMGRLPSHSFYL
jgi:hypothetical protein